MRVERLHRGQDDERRADEPAPRKPLPSPAVTPGNIAALQTTVGNAALARLVRAQRPVLARTKPEHVEPLKTWRGNLQVLDDTVAALLANERKYNAMYEGGST